MPDSKRPFRFPAIAALAALAAATAAVASSSPPRSTPDLEGLWATTLQSIATQRSSDPVPQTWYVSVTNKEGKVVDAPAATLAQMNLPGVTLKPVSEAPKNLPDSVQTMTYIIYGIGAATRRDDGRYEVAYNAYRPACSKEVILVMSHDKTGWHYVSQSLKYEECT